MCGGTTGPTGIRRKEAMVASQHVEIAQKAYEAYGAGDVETALADFDDNIEWSIPGNSAISGDYRGKDQFMQLLGKLAEKSFTTTPERIVGEGDDVVVITKTTAGGESGLQADGCASSWSKATALRTVCGLSGSSFPIICSKIASDLVFLVPPLGLEPRTCGLKVRSSTN